MEPVRRSKDGPKLSIIFSVIQPTLNRLFVFLFVCVKNPDFSVFIILMRFKVWNWYTKRERMEKLLMRHVSLGPEESSPLEILFMKDVLVS